MLQICVCLDLLHFVSFLVIYVFERNFVLTVRRTLKGNGQVDLYTVSIVLYKLHKKLS